MLVPRDPYRCGFAPTVGLCNDVILSGRPRPSPATARREGSHDVGLGTRHWGASVSAPNHTPATLSFPIAGGPRLLVLRMTPMRHGQAARDDAGHRQRGR